MRLNAVTLANGSRCRRSGGRLVEAAPEQDRSRTIGPDRTRAAVHRRVLISLILIPGGRPRGVLAYSPASIQ